MMPKIDTFGASFFEWDQGSAGRIVLFLRTLGYFNHVEPMPVQERGQQFETARAMPAWPAPGSVKVNGNAVIVKFGEYSSIQKRGICETTRQREFCGNN